jgi:hypothetical protein
MGPDVRPVLWCETDKEIFFTMPKTVHAEVWSRTSKSQPRASHHRDATNRATARPHLSVKAIYQEKKLIESK